MIGYIVFSLWVFVPLIIAYILYKLKAPNDIVVIIALIGFLMSIYWILLMTVTIVYGIKKLIELGNVKLFIQELIRQINNEICF